MFASIRHYRLHGGATDELARRVDEGLAEEISSAPGFVAYEFIDCEEGEVVTLSLFRQADQAEASSNLAWRWSVTNLKDFRFSRIELLHGEVFVSRAAGELLEPGHVGAGERFASVRRYRFRRGEVAELMHVVDEVFADQIQQMDGFEAYDALDCGHGDLVSISLFRDQSTAEESDDLSLEFVKDKLGEFDIERTDVIGGRIRVSRAVADALEPTHA